MGCHRNCVDILDSNRQPAMGRIGRQTRFDRLIHGVPTIGYAAASGPVALAKYLVRRYLK